MNKAHIAERLLAIVDMDLCDQNKLAPAYQAEELIEAGAALIVLRSRSREAGELLRLTLALVPSARRAGARLLINDRVDVAIAAGADGVHLPTKGLDAATARRLLGPDRIIGVSSHGQLEVERAERNGADYVTLSPVFRSLSKPGYGGSVTPEDLKLICQSTPMRVYALSGMTPDRVSQVAATGAFGVAAMGSLCGPHGRREVTRFLQAIQTAWPPGVVGGPPSGRFHRAPEKRPEALGDEPGSARPPRNTIPFGRE